jgi:hypothetical protein
MKNSVTSVSSCSRICLFDFSRLPLFGCVCPACAQARGLSTPPRTAGRDSVEP